MRVLADGVPAHGLAKQSRRAEAAEQGAPCNALCRNSAYHAIFERKCATSEPYH